MYRIDEGTALVFTADFFTPIVDDPYDWGRIAAANALSDVYAMGGRPVLCLNLTGWPHDTLPLEQLARVLEGGAAVARAAGALIAGGHTIDDREPKYGMAVIGLVDPARVVTNAAARSGDVLVLTKPIGLGVISTAIKNERADDDLIAAAIETMTTLNAAGAEAMTAAGVQAATDVTGFGLLGHLQRMADGSGVSAEVEASAVPVLAGARALAEAGQIPSGSRRNRGFLEATVRFDDAVPEPERVLLTDAQTSGGLLICCPPDRLPDLHEQLRARDTDGAEIGRIIDGPAGIVTVRE